VKRKFGLASVLRVRRIQEEVARVEVVRAHAGVHTAWTDAERRQALLQARRGTVDGSSSAFLGALTAGLARASDLSAARAAHQLAQDHAAAQVEAWSVTAARVKALESLEERHRAAVRQADEAAAQSASDDRSSAVAVAKLRAGATLQEGATLGEDEA
jgi:flagellar FliJ protein